VVYEVAASTALRHKRFQKKYKTEMSLEQFVELDDLFQGFAKKTSFCLRQATLEN